MARVSGFTVDDLEEFSVVLRTIGEGASDMQDAAGRIVHYFHDNLGEGETRDCLTVSLYKTHTYRYLPERLQALAKEADDTVDDGTACLVRMATVGYEEPEPQAASLVRPLTPIAFEEQPILVGLLVAMGLDVDAALDPERMISTGIHRQQLDMFHVPDLATSEWVDEEARAQLDLLGLSSLLGLGGGLPTGDLFFLFLFTCERTDERSADLMRSLAPALKATLIPHARMPFAEG